MKYAAPAKVNLSLLVDPPDSSGLHPVDSIVQTVEWLDFLYLEEGESEDSVEVAELEIDDDENLVLRASRAVRNHADFPPVHYRLEKNIPTGAGLGGGSSDAAATLVAHVEDGHITRDLALEIAPSLGADVPLFLTGGTLRMLGYGESLTGLRPLGDFALLVVVPDFQLSTPEVYAAWDRLEGPTGEAISSASLPPSLRDSMPMRNDLLPAALNVEPLLGDFMADLRHALDTEIALTGSGSACFAYFTNDEEAGSAGDTVSGMVQRWQAVQLRSEGVARVSDDAS